MSRCDRVESSGINRAIAHLPLRRDRLRTRQIRRITSLRCATEIGLRESIKTRDSGVRHEVVRAVSNRDQAVLRLAVDTGQITVRQAAEQLHLSRAVAGATLRGLERAGRLDGHLVGGGEIGYRPTQQGRERLDETARKPASRPSEPACARPSGRPANSRSI